MPIDLASHPWFRKDNAHRWIFVRDAYHEFSMEQLVESKKWVLIIVVFVLSKLIFYSRRIDDALKALSHIQTPQRDASQPSTSTSTASASTGPTTPRRVKRKRGNAKSLYAQSKKPRHEVDIIELTSDESDTQPAEELPNSSNEPEA